MYYNKRLFIVLLMSFGLCQVSHPFPPLYLVTIPTSGTLPEGSFSFETLLINEGGLVPRLSVGITNNLTLGFSWGIQNLIGDIKPTLNKSYPDYHMKYRIWDEDMVKPGMVIGFDSQGRGEFIDTIIDPASEQGNVIEVNRYDEKSLGYYIVFSKNYNVFGNLGLHVGINKSLETDDGDEDLNLFFGIDKELNRSFSLMIEYNAMLNDNENLYDYDDISLGRGIGYLNAGLRWTIADNLLVELNFNDISQNQVISETAHREFKVLYSKSF